MKDDKSKRAILLEEVCNRLKMQIEGLGLLEDSLDANSGTGTSTTNAAAAALLARQNADRLKRKLLLEMLKRQLEEVS